MQAMIAAVFSKLRRLPAEKSTEHEFSSSLSLSEAFAAHQEAADGLGGVSGVHMTVPNPTSDDIPAAITEKSELLADTEKEQRARAEGQDAAVKPAAPADYSDHEGALVQPRPLS